MQLLWELGFINLELTKEEVLKHYSVNGKKDGNGNIIAGTNLKELVASLPGFEQEITLLQYRAQELGVAIDCSPKHPPEIF